MKIFITGVAGFLGSHLADRMLKLGHQVKGIDNLTGGDKVNIPNGVEFFHDDCDNLQTMMKITKNCDVIFHAACMAHDGLSIVSPYFVTKNTSQITYSVISAAVQNNIKRFIYCSSMARYGRQDIIPYTEDMTCNPTTPYGVAKYSSELVIKQLCELNNIEYVILVPHNIIGTRQKYDDPFRNVASIMINRMLQGKQPIIYGDGEQKRSFSFIDDTVYCLEESLTRKSVIGETINIGPDEEFITINHLSKVIAKIINFDLKPIYVPDRPNEVKLAYCSSNKARKLLDYKTKTNLEEGLIMMVDYIKKQGTKEFKYNIDLEIINKHTPKTWTEKMI